MEEFLQHYAQQAPLWVLFAVIAAMIFTLSKGADWLVEEAATLSVKWRMPKALIGATVVSMGTTLPEAAVSVLAAMQGQPDLAMGNAVGSIICDTGLILGLAAILTPLPLVRSVVNRQGWVQLAAGGLLVVVALPPLAGLSDVMESGGHVAQWNGFVLLALLVLYIWFSIRWARGESAGGEAIPLDERGTVSIMLKLFGGIALVVMSSQILIPAVEETALRLGVPTGVVAATLVAFGTSLPELVTAMTAVRRGHGEIAVGNVIGADILNVLFVVGAAASVTPGGLTVQPLFFKLLFPAMLGVLVLFRIFAQTSGTHLRRIHGVVLLAVYVVVTLMSYR
jgi:cation:H+ antiporter